MAPVCRKKKKLQRIIKPLIDQEGTHVYQLQSWLEKQREDQTAREQLISEEISGLVTKNQTLQARLNEMLKENKEFRTSLSVENKELQQH